MSTNRATAFWDRQNGRPASKPWSKILINAEFASSNSINLDLTQSVHEPKTPISQSHSNLGGNEPTVSTSGTPAEFPPWYLRQIVCPQSLSRCRSSTHLHSLNFTRNAMQQRQRTTIWLALLSVLMLTLAKYNR
ncbi:MAG: hypothetical protein R2838_04795 [Caldilineaceae bacterium]